MRRPIKPIYVRKFVRLIEEGISERISSLLNIHSRFARSRKTRAVEIEDLVDVLSILAQVIEPMPSVEPERRDVSDQALLGTLLAALKTSGADYLIGGDKDLLAMADRYPIVDPAKFWATHAGL